jgi:hypothetical protein
MASSDDVLMRGMSGFRKEVGQPLKVPVEPGQYDSSVSDRYNQIREELVRPEYRGFTVPAGMEQDESDRWFAAIDVREDERERKEAESFLTRKPEPYESQFLEQIKSLNLAASQEEQRFLRDPETRGEAYKEFAGEVYEDVMAGDPETIRNVADVSSLVDITGTSDVTSAVQSGRLAVREPEQMAEHLTAAGISGVAGGIQLAATALGAAPLVGNLLSGARLKAAMKADSASLSKAEEAIAAKDPVFESALEKAAVEKIQNKTGVDAVISTLRSGGATKSEIADTKVAEFVEQAKAAGKKSVTKDELIKHLDDNKVQIDEVRLGGSLRKLPKEIEDLSDEKFIAFEALESEATAASRVLAPDESASAQFDKLLDNPNHFTRLYLDYVGGTDRIEGFENVPPGVEDVVNGVIDLNKNVPVSDWTPEDAARITEARNAVNAKMDDPDYQRMVDLEYTKLDESMTFRTHPDEPIGDILQQYENLATIAAILNKMPEAETRLAALRQFQSSPKYQEYSRLSEDFRQKYIAFQDDTRKFTAVYERYSVPHGDNYQEILLTVPVPKGFREVDADDMSKVFRDSHHSDIPNVLVHIRTKDRYDHKGRKILFVEEIQSDWHQMGRRRGYASKPIEVTNIDGKVVGRFATEEEAIEFGDDLEGGFNYRRSIDPTPDAPLKDTKEWTALAIRRIFREAADGGYDGVSFSRADMITPVVTLPRDEAMDLIGEPEAFLQRLENLKQQGEGFAEGAEQAEKVFKGNQYYYDKLLPSIAKKESKGDAATTLIELKDVGFSKVKERHTPGMSYPMFDRTVELLVDRGEVIEVPFFELTDKVRDRVIKPQKLYSVALPGIAVGAAAAEEEELSAAAALGALGMGGMALYKGAKAARVADLKVPTETSAYEGQQTVGKVVFDSKDGMGAVPNSKNVAYKGFVVWMKPQDFLGLNPVRSSESAADTVKAVTEAIEEGKPIGPPFLNVKLVKDGDDAGSFQVVQHEGRGRMAAINSIQPDVPVPVHVFGRGAIDRGRDLTPEMMQGLVDPTSNVRLLPDKKATDGKAVTPDAAWHVPDSDDYDPNYLPVGKTYRADVAKPPAAAMKLPETRQEIDEAFKELGRLQNDRPETAMYDMQRSKVSPLWSQTAEHVGDIIRRMTPSGPGEMYRPPEMDIIPKTRRGIADLSGDIEGGIRSQAGTEAKLNELRALGQKYADEHRKLPVYNELQMLANDAAIALGEGRFADAKAALVKLDKIYRENPDKFSDRLQVVEPEFARPGSTAAKPPAPDAATAGAKTADEAEEAARLWREKGTKSPFFKRWFGKSKVVDEAGEPLVVYHGSVHSKGFESFDPDKTGEALDSGWYGKGFYFSDDPSIASAYAGGGIDTRKILDQVDEAGFAPTSGTGSIAPVYLSLRNPYDVGPKPFGVRGLVRAGERLPDDLHDAVVAKVGFDPSAAKNPFIAGESKTGEAGADIIRQHLIDRGTYRSQNSIEFRVKSYLENPGGFWFRLTSDVSPEAMTKALKADGFDGILQKDAGAGTITLPWADWGVRTTNDAEKLFSEAMTSVLKEQGYDGVVAGLRDGRREYLVFDPTQIKSIKNPGTFDPTDPRILKGIGVGAAVPAAAAVRSQRQEEQGNPLSEPPEYEPVSYEGGYSQAIDFSETAALVEKMIGLSNEAQDLYTQMGLIEAEYGSLTEEDKIGKRGKLLAEWYDDSADKFSEAGRQLDESEYDRYLMGSDTYYDTDPKGIQGYDDVRLFVNTGYSGDPMLLDADLRASQENKQRNRLKETIGNGGPMLDMFSKSGNLNRYLYQKAKFFEHPVQTVQLNSDQKRILAKDYYNLEALKETGLISYLLYKELLGNVELV